VQFWMKCVWALAAVAVVACLLALGGTTGRSGSTATTQAAGPEYFTQRDPNRAVVQYGVRENGRTLIYSSQLAR
jgi:hypothetical protein